MQKQTKSKRGMTLVELSVVLAVIAIASTMVVSFLLMVSARRKAATERLEALTDIELVESVTESWIENNPGCSVASDALTNPTDTTRALVFTNGKLLHNGKAMPLNNVTDVTFSFSAETGANDVLYIVKVEYTVADKADSYIFCVNPYVGEGVTQ